MRTMRKELRAELPATGVRLELIAVLHSLSTYSVIAGSEAAEDRIFKLADTYYFAPAPGHHGHEGRHYLLY